MPPMVTGMIKQMAKDIPDDQLREMCARVALGMLNIYTGGDVKASLDLDSLESPDMDLLIEKLSSMRTVGSTETIPVLTTTITLIEDVGSDTDYIDEITDDEDEREELEADLASIEDINESVPCKCGLPLEDALHDPANTVFHFYDPSEA